jgi:DNA-binding transcriptional LysR family regulator
MEWDDLKYFLAVARTGSITKAARSLRTSAATVSRRVATLEKKVHVRLLDRKPNGYSLTDSGEAVRLKAEEIEQAILAVERDVVGRDLRPSGVVRVTTGDDVAAVVIAPRLPDFVRRCPDISLEIIASFDVANLARRDADVALRTVRPMQGDFFIRQAGWWELGLYATKAYARTRDLRPGATDLSNADIITWNQDYLHLGGGQWLAEHARSSRIVLAANSRLIQQAACKAGIGVAILPCLSADRDPDLIRLLPPERVRSVKLWLVVHRDIAHTARVRTVMDFLVQIGPKRSRS